MKLISSVGSLPFVGPQYKHKLEKLAIFSIQDLLFHIPSKYFDFRLTTEIAKVQPGVTLTIKGYISDVKNVYTKRGKNFQTLKVTDATGSITVVFFNQPFIVKTLIEGEEYSFSGKADFFSRKIALISPQFERSGLVTLHTGRLVPQYPETAGITSKWLRARIKDALARLDPDEYEEYLPGSIVEKHKLMSFMKAIERIHFPRDEKEAQVAKDRLAFEELLLLHLRSFQRKKEWLNLTPASILKPKKEELANFIVKLPFELTPSQKKVISEITQDLAKDKPMNRLLEGDVGSGKTVVAAVGAYAAFLSEKQTVVMAPTQILAQQHFKTLSELLEPFKIRLSVVTAQGEVKDPGRTDIFIGTHALLHKKVPFDNVAFVVIDEQHRFGVEQRTHLIEKTTQAAVAPHVLTMTATPIPRTIALTLYGDLDLSVLTDMPKGRKPITTWLVPKYKRLNGFRWIDSQIEKENVQVFIIYPLIDESEYESMKEVKAATVEFEKLVKLFPKRKVGLLHGRQKAKEKDQILSDFKEKKFDILVSTPVVEVGIDIPNATIMVIEAAERFGLAQLHQLRGRVGRSEKKSYCLLLTESETMTTQTRLSAMQTIHSGFELAELDLKLRGPGEVYGLRQHGFSELKIASWQDSKLIMTTRKIAEEIYKNPTPYQKVINKAFPKDQALN